MTKQPVPGRDQMTEDPNCRESACPSMSSLRCRKICHGRTTPWLSIRKNLDPGLDLHSTLPVRRPDTAVGRHFSRIASLAL